MQFLSLVIAGQLPEGNQPACRAGELANILHHLGRGHQDHKPQVLCNKYQFQGDFPKLLTGLMQSSMWSSPRLRGRLHTLSLSLTSWRGKSSSASRRFHSSSRWKAPLNCFEVNICTHFDGHFLLRFKTRRRRSARPRRRLRLKEKLQVIFIFCKHVKELHFSKMVSDTHVSLRAGHTRWWRYLRRRAWRGFAVLVPWNLMSLIIFGKQYLQQRVDAWK